MGSIYRAAKLTVPADVAWDFLDRYTRSEVHVFSACQSERQEGDYRVVTLADGSEIWERNVTVDPATMRAVYTIPGFPGAEHHQAEMRVLTDGDGVATVVWTTDLLPHELVESLSEAYEAMFGELVAAINAHGARSG
ncbi:SRPBCC family protein [Micromonospora sp. C28SCA-DRY-2]|uniref:SRPBCC family protein n=1 Tax=Micromonospora sp. C28SCA-DRY-2 TaxID=3059522 RepID=UPI002674507F|nr:SRPBCC family protein [Micromonospora sp. C28SCA-DRY-2]MDO3703262.1 SRPBCC family protein [Micromonospora sp. C28SCA-DRY-2]